MSIQNIDFGTVAQNDGEYLYTAFQKIQENFEDIYGGLGAFAVSDVASATTCDIGAATTPVVRITGTTTITSFGSVANTRKYVYFAASLLLTHNATSLILEGSRNVQTAAGDAAIFVSDASGNWRCFSYEPATGDDLLSAKEFGAVGDGSADDTIAIQAALSTGKPIYFPPGTYKITAVVNITVSGTCILGSGRGKTAFASTSSGHTFNVATGLSYVEFRDFTLSRTSTPAIAGQNGIHFANLTERALIENVEVTSHWEGVRLGITSYSRIKNLFVDNNYSNGILVTNSAGAGGLQWYMEDILTQRNDGYGVRYVGTTSAAVGTVYNILTYANKLGGMAFEGSSGNALNAIRIEGGFFGEDGKHSIYLDTYGSATHVIKNVYTEANGTVATGVNQSTALSNQGCGIFATANNTAIQVSNFTATAHSWSGVSSASPRLQITDSNFRLCGAAGLGGELAGINISAGRATIVGNSSLANPLGVALGNDGSHVLVGNDLSENTTTGLSAASYRTCFITNNSGISTTNIPSGGYAFAGSSSGSTTLQPSAAASGTLTMPAATDTLVGKATTDVLTNKTYDTAGTGNSFSIDGLAATANTGTGAVVRATSPALVTPALGTPTAGVLTSCTGLPVGSGISGLATGVATFLATPSSANLAAALTDETGTGGAVFANTPTLVSPLLGTPTSGVLTNCTSLPVASGISGLGSGVATFLATPSSANLASVVTDETGSGALVFGTSPTITTSLIGAFGGTSNARMGATSNYNFLSFNNVTTLAGLLGIFGGASGDANTLYYNTTASHVFWVNGTGVCQIGAGGISPATDGGTYFGLSSLRWAGGLFKPFTVATLPAGTQGQLAYASDLRVFNGTGTQQGAAAGTGGFVQYNGTAWKNFDAQSVTAVA